MNSALRICFLNRKALLKLCSFESVRHIFSPSSLGLIEFQNYRRKVRESIPNIDELKRKHECLCADKNSMIFLDDLRKMVTITENKNDIKLLVKALRKYSSQKTVIFNECTIGADVMRLLHVMGEPMEAANLVEHEETLVYFKNITAHIILLDMLFKNKNYAEVIKRFEYYQSKILLEYTVEPLSELFFAACYKLNTQESFMKALAFQQKKYKIIKKSWCRSKLFFAALAVNQSQPLFAIEAISDIQFNSLAENIRFMAYAAANRFEDIFQSIRNILQSPEASFFFVLKDVLFIIEKRAQYFSEDSILELKKLKEELIIHNCYKNETLDEELCAELDFKLKKRKGNRKSIVQKEKKNFSDLKLNVSSV